MVFWVFFKKKKKTKEEETEIEIEKKSLLGHAVQASEQAARGGGPSTGSST